ncbi:hypothetical protein BIW11_11157 [Tropilaelaps mercedesae]|uniref:Uncharacterized protein n=1 Tax=Tropilaelaps mercedesae TaxID=418985 RepID=A0A1V9XCR3_9ACAR|nr:hypothetical protein BIW11_11157 [Tropilaelaps mercedesae]
MCAKSLHTSALRLLSVNTCKMTVQLEGIALVMVLVWTPSGLTAPPSNEKVRTINVIMEAAHIDLQCKESNWMDKLTIECKTCSLMVQLKDCGFPKAVWNTSNLYEMQCSSNVDIPDEHNLKLHCPVLNPSTGCKANCEMALQSSRVDVTKYGTLWTSIGNSVPGIAGGIMALILLAFLIYIIWRLRKRNQERNVRMQTEI